jgi:hypothetical protein
VNSIVGWVLAAVLAVASFGAYGWQGLALAVSVIVFWLLLQFNRAMRVMKNAAQSPVGEIPNAVMFNARLESGLTMLQIVTRTKSLGRKVEGSEDDWAWHDAGGSSVTLHFERGRLKRWQLERPAEEPGGAPGEPDRAT